MIPARWQQISDLLYEAMQLDPRQRPAFLEQVGSSDEEIRRELESLLDAHDKAAPSFLDGPETGTHDPSLAARGKIVGRRFGDYRIIELIGEGGMGEVYRAIRDDDQYHKAVAVKLVRAGEDSGFVLRRFRNERQILASLDHPNIARLLDGGTTDDGMPFFVMELIEGEPIDRYCDRHQISVDQRLELFLQICSAVQFAHQRLIIHRDIKPGNILVTSGGVPKLLDFGIAKILDQGIANGEFEPTLTLFRVLTPAYASPEQVKGGPITTASDVYSLGVVLYELLTGLHPYRQHDSIPEEVARAVCEIEPMKPSTAVRRTEAGLPNQNSQPSSEGRFSEANPGRLSKRLRGDLDKIVLMALRKEPQRRYASVDQFAADIRRHLDNLPVTARKDTTRYRLSKFVARHKAAVAAVAVALLTLIVGFVITVREARIAERRFNDVRALANSLIFDVHDSIKDLPGSTPARKIIVDRALQYLNRLAQESKGDLGLQRELATAYERVGLVQGHYMEDNLGDTRGSLDSYQKALGIRKQVDAKSRDWSDRLALAQTYRLVANLQGAIGKTPEARDSIDHAIAITSMLRQVRPADPEVLSELGMEYDRSSATGQRNDPDEKQHAFDDLHKALSTYEAALRVKPDDPRLLDLYANDVGVVGQSLVGTDPRAALPYYQRELEIERNLTQRSDAVRYKNRVAHAYGQLADAYEYLGDNTREFENASNALAIFQQLSRADPKNVTLGQHVAIAYINSALARARLGRFKSSLDDWNKGVDTMRRLVSSDPQNKPQQHYLASATGAGGIILMRAHQPQAALKQFEQARSIDQSLFDAGVASDFDIANMAECSEKMGEASALAGKPEEASEYFHQALVVAEPLISSNHDSPDYFHDELVALYAAADAYSGLGDLSFKKARQPGHSPARLRANWIEAQSWYAKSLGTWRRIGHPNRTAGANSFDVGDPAVVAKRLQQCDTALTGMTTEESSSVAVSRHPL